MRRSKKEYVLITIFVVFTTALLHNYGSGFAQTDSNNSTLKVHPIFTESSCATGYYNQTARFEGEVGKILTGQLPLLIKVFRGNDSEYRLDQIPAANMSADGVFQYVIKISGKSGVDWYRLQFIYGDQSYESKLPIQPPECGEIITSQYKGVDITALSPLKQIKSGMKAQDVKCKYDLQLVIKAEDGSPACVKPTSVEKLVMRGWAKQT